MAFKEQVSPAQIATHQGQTLLVTRPDGQVNWPSARGLYFRDTRWWAQSDHVRWRGLAWLGRGPAGGARPTRARPV